VTFDSRLSSVAKMTSFSSDSDSEMEYGATAEPSTIADGDTSDKQIPSLLDKLKSPALSDLSRKRKLKCNRPPKGLKRCKGAVASEPVNISLSTRIREFPNENLTNHLGKLFCNACREVVSLKKSVLTQYIKSAKHANGKEQLVYKEVRDKNLAEMLKKYDEEKHPVGEGLCDAVRVFRVSCLSIFKSRCTAG
jgi:hypothetical protein